jgi:methionine-rich copper-binding protein CopC
LKRVLILIAAIAGTAHPAMSHAFLEQARPAAGENLKASPARIELHFTEPLEAAFSGITVTAENGAEMSAGPATVADGTEMDVALKKLPPGRYRVEWHAVSVDTHRTQGKYNFLVLP